MNQVRSHAYRAGLIVEDDHGAGPQAAAHFLHLGEIHGHVEMLLHQKIGGGAARAATHESATRRAFHPRVLREFRASCVPIGSSHSPGRFTLPLAP